MPSNKTTSEQKMFRKEFVSEEKDILGHQMVSK